MQFLPRATARAAVIALVFFAAAVARAQVNGIKTISAPTLVVGQPLTVSTSSQYGGAVSSIKWGSKEYINNWDHGRQLSLDSQFFNAYICYNPYESGSFEDAKGPTSTSKLLSIS